MRYILLLEINLQSCKKFLYIESSFVVIIEQLETNKTRLTIKLINFKTLSYSFEETCERESNSTKINKRSNCLRYTNIIATNARFKRNNSIF